MAKAPRTLIIKLVDDANCIKTVKMLEEYTRELVKIAPFWKRKRIKRIGKEMCDLICGMFEYKEG